MLKAHSTYFALFSMLLSSTVLAATEFPGQLATELQPAPARPAPAQEVIEPVIQETVPPVPEMVPAVVPKLPAKKEMKLLGSVSDDDPPPVVTPVETPTMPVLLDIEEDTNLLKSSAETEATLRLMLVHVYETHPQLAAEREKLKAMDETVAIAISDFRPDIRADYSKGRERENNSTTSRWDYGDTTSKGLVVTQPVFSGLSGVAGLKAAKKRVSAARADLIALEQQVLYNAIVAYTDIVEKHAVLLLAQNNVDVLTSQRDAVQVRYDVGELTRTDVAQAEARLANAIANEQQAVGDLAIARANYKRFVGGEPPENIAMPSVPSDLPQNLDEAIRLAKAANPVLTSAKQREKAFASDVNVQAGGLLPSVDIQGSMRRSEGGNVFVNRYENDALTLNVNIPLYQSGAQWARMRQARNTAQQAKFSTMDTALAVAQDANSAWQNYVTAESIILSTQKAAVASELALEGVRQESQFGVRTVLDVLDAEQEFLDTKVNLVRATRNHKIQAYRLLASVGRLTAEQLGLGIKTHNPKENYDNVKYQLLGW